MKNRIRYVLILFLPLLACEKEDSPLSLPPPGDVRQMTISIASDYSNQVFVDLEAGTQVVRSYRNWDIAFESDPSGSRIYLNTAKYMFATACNSHEMSNSDTTGANWRVDNEQAHPDSTAVGNWWLQTDSSGHSAVYVIDRGRYEYTGSARFRKLQILRADNNQYEIQFSTIDNSGLTTYTLNRDSSSSLTYFTFDGGGQTVLQAPPSGEWDLLFTKYTHVYFDEPLGSPFRYYQVTGALSNRWKGLELSMLRKDSLPNYKPFTEFSYYDVFDHDFKPDADGIGFDWKYFDFGLNRYFIRPDQYYLMRDDKGYYFKIRFIDFYSATGEKGTITFEYQRI